MNRGYESGDRCFFDRKDTKSAPGAQRQLVFHCDSGPGQTAVSTASDRLQEASSKFQAQQRHPPPQRPASPSVLRQAAPPPATATAPRMLQTTLVPGHPQDCSITPSIGKNGPPRVTSECVSGHVNCTWPHDIRAQPCKHRRLKGRSRNHKVLPRSPYPLESVHMSSSLTLFLDKTPFFT